MYRFTPSVRYNASTAIPQQLAQHYQYYPWFYPYTYPAYPAQPTQPTLFLVGLKNAVSTFPQKENIIETADTEMKGLVLQHPQEVG
ncbi:hypothetical protein [Paenibacillus pseudetheri]|uniref:Uncharacterized protein n=1 Tax=Paenibacillus pseudetheri TaxID=2897682 RepID=A0ABM9B8P2_9BACL|nr:hypothetical protein [Paenibacillus pseudetheri]CAH1054902.1 hypothetical protein PAECIP111894_01052 [Paenibacillus pseudetheri]